MHPAERAECDAWRSLAAVDGISVLEIGDGICVSMPLLRESPMVNRTIGVVDGDALEAIAEFFGNTRYHVALTPDAPADMHTQLAARGFTHGYDWMKFTRGTTDVPESHSELELRRVDDDGADFADVALAGYELPAELASTLVAIPSTDACQAYVAYSDGEPAAAGAIFISGDVAWLGFAATKPEHRRKGGQSAILAARLARARELGVRTVVTETGVMQDGRPSSSYRNIVRSGFEEAYVRKNYLSPARETAASYAAT